MTRWSKDRTLPKYCYARGNRLWIRVKDEQGQWTSRPTTLTADRATEAPRFIEIVQTDVATRRALLQDATKSVAGYVNAWLDDRQARGIPSVVDERGRLEKYALPYVGGLLLAEIRPRHVRDMVRVLKAMPKEERLAPRTILHVYRALHNVFESAVVEELVQANPVNVLPHELPKDIDKDPEWRSRATYTVYEVEALLSDVRVPMARRVLYALKAIAGLRHGEAAALCWRHRDHTARPLARINIVQALCSRTGTIKSTKTEETRAVPEHPTLTKILTAWRAQWTRVYGREPTQDDYIVPSSDLHPIHVKVAGAQMKRDLKMLGFRVEAGSIRDRGGHDLRSWYKTRMIEDGADSLIVRRTTHASPKDVDGGYERFSWATMCREVSKLKITQHVRT